MKIIDLHDITADFSEAGGKAAGLHRLAVEGFRIPRGFVIIDANSEKDFETATDYYLHSGFSSVAVRSSASGEDGSDFSGAGQYSTFLNVSGEQLFKEAVAACVRSLSNATAQSYSSYFKQAHSTKMSVVVQEMVKPKAAGVCFTKSPSDKNFMLAEAVAGLGEALVSGAVGAKQYSVPRAELQLNGSSNPEVYQNICGDESLLSGVELHNLCSEALKIEQLFGMPLDTEWALSHDGTLYWLQARPITSADDCGIDELDAAYNMDGMVITRCNIGEMLPSAVTPLTVSTSLFAIDYGMREMLRVAGVLKTVNSLPDYSCALSVSNHLFLNLTPLYKMDGTVVGASKDNIEFSICGKVLNLPNENRGTAGFFRRLNNGRKYFGFLLSRNKARRELAQIASELKIGENETTPEGLYKAIDDNKRFNDRAMTLHYVTSSHSGAMNGAMFQVLKTKMDDEAAKSIIAELLENIDGIESVDILRSLRVLAKAMINNNPKVKSYGIKELSAYLKTAGNDVAEAHRQFKERHGHRTIREAEMRNKGWADDETAFLEYLKTVISSGAEELPKSAAPDIKSIVKKHGFKGMKKSILVYLAKQSRQGVVNREYSKSKIIKVMDIFKKAYARLAAMLKDEGALPETDLIYFLTHAEIGQLLREKRYSLIKKAMKRRRLLDEQMSLAFDEVNNGKPVAVPPTAVCASAGTLLNGAPISRGVATGKARVIKSEYDARALQKDEIMVASYTDIGWSPYYCLIRGLITEVGSALSHGAVVAREYSLPLVSNIANATRLIRTGDIITVDGNTGSVIVH